MIRLMGKKVITVQLYAYNFSAYLNTVHSFYNAVFEVHRNGPCVIMGQFYKQIIGK